MLANVTWPALVYYNRSHAWWVILLAIVLEFILLRKSLKATTFRAFGVVVVINVFTAVVP